MNDNLDIWKLINRRIGTEITQLREDFETAVPFPHLIIDNFFTTDFLAEIERDFPVRDEEYDRFCMEDGGVRGTNYANGEVGSFPPAFRKLDSIVKSEVFRQYISAVTGIRDLEYDADYFGGGIRESRTGTFLPPHVDFNHHPKTYHHRRMNLLFYFNPEWQENWGGSLQVHKDPNVFSENSLVHSYMPVNNRCLIFETSEISWHGFDRLKLPEGGSRRAFTIYYYTKHRPNENQIRFHNTEYVEPPLPASFVPGYTLTEADVNLVKEYLTRRDQRIRLLYDLRAEMDAKLRDVWKHYEYYLNLSRSSTAKTLVVAGQRTIGNVVRSLRGMLSQ